MNIEDVAKRLAEVRKERDDCEGAHGLEDDLHQSVLRSIADGTCDDPPACASEALKTLKIRFSRWYA